MGFKLRVAPRGSFYYMQKQKHKIYEDIFNPAAGACKHPCGDNFRRHGLCRCRCPLLPRVRQGRAENMERVDKRKGTRP